MNPFERGEVRVEVVQELRTLATSGVTVPELVAILQQRLELNERNAVFPAIVYFRSAFDLSLREALPLREWIGGKDRSEVDSILIPAMQRSRNRWQSREVVPS